MRNLLCSTGWHALAAALAAGPSIDSGDTNYVSLDIAYDCFNLGEIEKHELQWRPGATLADYLKGLPAECEWLIHLNGEEVTLEEHGLQPLEKLDNIGLVLVPQGGNGMKNILRIALMAVSVVVAFIPGMQWWAAAGIALASGLISTFLLTPKPPKSNGKDDSKSYGIDGPKNSATEGIPYPVVYGEFRVAGNFSDCYTVNSGDDQYLYLRTVLNDGEIDSISDIEINEQPIANFKQVTTRLAKGTLTQGINTWFHSSIVQVNKGVKLDTSFTTHETTSAVDRVRLDLVFPEGLTNINTKTGDKGTYSVEIEAQYRLKGTTTWLALPLRTPPNSNSTSGGGGIFGGGQVGVGVKMSMKQAMDTATPVIATERTTGQVVTIGTIAATQEEREGYALDASGDGTLAGSTDATPQIQRNLPVLLPSGTWDITGTGVTVTTVTSASDTTNATGKVTFTDKRAKAIRKSIESATLPAKGIYEVRVRRTAAESLNEDHLDTVVLTDVAEIANDPVALRGTANLSLQIKLDDQLNGMPGLTTKVKGSLCRRYDDQGNVLDQVWTANPAWIGLDILCGPERGANLNTSRIDWPRWVEYAAWCDTNNIQFNGVFAEGTNLGDALRTVLRVGQAAPVPFGTKISVAVDRARSPVHVFGQGNIIKDSFQISYMSMADRANEYEFSYFDKNDRNKQKTIRYVDPKAVTFNETPRSAQVTLVGVDNVDQAKKEMWKQIYQNRLLIRNITFDSWLDSINMTHGEVALIQHDMMQWAKSGRLAAGSTTTSLKLDQKVTLDGASNVIVHFDSLSRGSTTVSSVVGKKLLVNKPSGANFTTDQLNAKRVIVSGTDYEVVSIVNGSTYHTITLATAPSGVAAGATVQLWDTDVLVEVGVSAVAQNADGTSTLTTSTALPAAPAQYANFAFGLVTTVRKPYVLTGINGNGLEKRKLSFIEYNEAVYGPPEVEIPIPVTQVSDRNVAHVRSLTYAYDPVVEADRSLIPVRIKWNSGHILNYAGADVFISINGEQPTTAGSAYGTSEFVVPVKAGDRISVSVCAFNKRGDRAPFVTAPAISGTISPSYASVDAPAVGAWTTVATLLTNNGTSVPAISVTGACENTKATGVIIYYRETGATDYTVASKLAPADKIAIISPVKAQTQYVVSVAYQVNGVTGLPRDIGTVTTGGMALPWDNVSDTTGTRPASYAGTTCTLVPFAAGQATIAGNSITKTAASAWNTGGAYIQQPLIGSAIAQFKIGTASQKAFQFGLATSGWTTSGTGSTTDQGFYCYSNSSAGTMDVMYGGVIVGSTPIDLTAVYTVTYDGVVYRAYKGTTLIVTVNAAGTQLNHIVKARIFHSTASLTDIMAGTLSQNDWGSLGQVPANLAELVGNESIQNQAVLNVIASDNILSMLEKQGNLSTTVADIVNRYQQLLSRANAAGISTTNLSNYYTNWYDFLSTNKAFVRNEDTTIYTNAWGDETFSATNWITDEAITDYTTSDLYKVQDTNTSSWNTTRRRKDIASIPNKWVNGSNYLFMGGLVVQKKTSDPGYVSCLRMVCESSPGVAVKYGDMVFDAYTGAVTGSANFFHYDIHDLGDCWLVFAGIETTSTTTQIVQQIFPAYGPTPIGSGSANGALTGSINIKAPLFVNGGYGQMGRYMLTGLTGRVVTEMTKVAKALSERDGTTGLVINPVAQVVIAADTTGVIKTGQLPRNVAVTASVGTATVTTLGSWSLGTLPEGITCTIGAATGVLNITALTAANVLVPINFVYNGVTRSITVNIVRQDDPPTNSGGTTSGGGTTVTTTTLANTTGTTYDLTNAVSATLTAKAGSAGQVVCTAPITFRRTNASVVGNTGAAGKWQWRVVGGSWADIDATEVTQTTNCRTIDSGDGMIDTLNGSISVTKTKTGLTAGTSYEFRFVWRHVSNSGTSSTIMSVSGTLQAAGS